MSDLPHRKSSVQYVEKDPILLENPSYNKSSSVVIGKDVILLDYSLYQTTPVAFIEKDAVPLGEQNKAVYRQEIAALLINAGIFFIGIGLALPAVTLDLLTDPNQPVFLSKSEGTWFASASSITAPLGALFSAYWIDAIGRKNTVVLVNILAIIAWALMAFAIYLDKVGFVIQLMLSRCIFGIALGLGSSPSAMYGAEISMPKLRGALALGASLAAAAGMVMVYTLGYFIRDWHLLAFVILGYQVVCLFFLIPIRETPNWLLTKDRVVEAKESLSFFRGLNKGETHKEVNAEFLILQTAIEANSNRTKQSAYKYLNRPEVYKPLLIVIGMFTFQQLSGNFVIIVYAVQIAKDAGVKIDPILCAILIGLGRFVTTAFLRYFLELWGRRISIFVSGSGMAICLLFIALSEWIPDLNSPLLSVVCLVLCIMLSTMGIYTMPFFIISELFPQKVRGACAGISVCYGLGLSFFVLKLYPLMLDYMGTANIFLFFGFAAAAAVVYSYIFLPETRGKTLLEIEDYFRNGKWSSKDMINEAKQLVKQVP